MGDAWDGSWGSSWGLSWTRSAYEAIDDDDFSLWLSTPSKRCVLAEFSATGYDALGSPAQTKIVDAYISNRGFTSHSTDTPASQHYNSWITGIPTFRREMGVALSGRATTGFGTLKVSNPASGGAGVRDDWLRMKWKRDYVTLYIGEGRPWHKADFRKLVVGTLGQPTAPKVGEIEFAIADILDRLDRPLQVNRYTTGPMAGKLKPILQGYVLWMEPVPTSTGTLELQINDGPLEQVADVYDDGVTLIGSGEIASVDAGTNTITTVEPHGLAEDARVWYFGSPGDPPPAPLATETYYYVISAGLGASTYRLSATRGGSEIDLTNTDAGAVFNSYGWWEDLPNGLITLTAAPAGRVMVKGAVAGSSAKLPDVISALIFDRFGLSTDFKDQDSFDDLEVDVPNNVGVVFYDHDSPTALGALEALCKGSNCWYGSTPDGLISVGRLKLPETTAELEFTASEVKDGSLRLVNRILPVNLDTLAVRVSRQFYLNGPLNLSPDKDDGSGIVGGPFYTMGTNVVSWPVGTVPLDDHPDAADVVDLPPLDSYFSSPSESPHEHNRLQTFRAKTLGTFAFETKLKACRLKIGQTIQLTHPRLGWKEYDGSDPQSPDNMANFDATKAVVVGIDVNLSAADPFPVKLTVFRQIPGYYPTEDLN